MKIRRQYIGKASIREMLIGMEKDTSALERAGVVPTRTVIHTNPPPRKTAPANIPQNVPQTIPIRTFVPAPLEGYSDYFSNSSGINFAGYWFEIGLVHLGVDVPPDLILDPDPSMPWLSSQIVPSTSDRTLVLILMGVTSPTNSGFTWTLRGSCAVVGAYSGNVEIWSATLPANHDINSDDTHFTMYGDGQRYWDAFGTQIGGSFPFEYHAASVQTNWGLASWGGNNYHIAWGPDGLHWDPFYEMYGNSTGSSGVIPIAETGPVTIPAPYSAPSVTFSIHWNSDDDVTTDDLIVLVARLNVLGESPGGVVNQYPTSFDITYPGLSFTLQASERYDILNSINNSIIYNGLLVYTAIIPNGFDFTNTADLGLFITDKQLYNISFSCIVIKKSTVVNVSSTNGTGLTVTGSVIPSNFELFIAFNSSYAYPISGNYTLIHEAASYYQGGILGWISNYENPLFTLQDPGVDVAWASVTLALSGHIPTPKNGDDFENAIHKRIPFQDTVPAETLIKYSKQILDAYNKYSIWYKGTPSGGTYTITASQVGAMDDPYIEIYSGDGVNDFMYPGVTYENGDFATLDLISDGSSTYYIRIGTDDATIDLEVNVA